MARITFAGPLFLRIKSAMALNRIAMATYLRHLLGQRLAPDWDVNLEIGIRFWRHQFSAAMGEQSLTQGRLLFDSLQTETDVKYDINIVASSDWHGTWHHPVKRQNRATILYLHGGGYAFHGAMSRRFASMLAHHTGADVFAPDYRLTPEHPHPAQAEDALTAWRNLTTQIPPKEIVVIGDSAGGHMALMLLQTLKQHGLEQPALCIGLCPWTDIGERGQSFFANDKYDLVQGWMALKFGEWLDPKGQFGREALSPITYDYCGLAPIYLQAGGREILYDMIAEFAQVQTNNGADVTFDEWPDMPHDFQAYDSLKPSSLQALKRIVSVIETRMKAIDNNTS